MSRGRERKISGAIQRLVAEIAPQDPITRIRMAWPKVVGDSIAKETYPSSLRGGVLTITCSSSVWAQELDLLSRKVLERLDEEFENSLAQRLRCVVGANR